MSQLYEDTEMSTFQKPSNKSRKTTHGFRKRMKTSSGRDTINRRRRKGRHTISV